MKVEQLAVPKEKARVLYKEYKEALQKHKDQFLQDMKRIYGHMKHGRSIIDIYEAFKETGLSEERNPKLAISAADTDICNFRKESKGSGLYYWKANAPWRAKKTHKVRLPEGTWEFPVDEFGMPLNQDIGTIVPTIPAHFYGVIKHNLRNYHILWEVDEWRPHIIPKDPMLLKRVTPNIFVVLATWDLTSLERAVIRGRIL